MYTGHKDICFLYKITIFVDNLSCLGMVLAMPPQVYSFCLFCPVLHTVPKYSFLIFLANFWILNQIQIKLVEDVDFSNYNPDNLTNHKIWILISTSAER
jgi:hypothetical protein